METGTVEKFEPKHGRCRKACAKAMGILRKPYHKSTRVASPLRVDASPLRVDIEIAVRELTKKGEYEALNLFGTIWTGKACCRWRARAKAAKMLASCARNLARGQPTSRPAAASCRSAGIAKSRF